MEKQFTAVDAARKKMLKFGISALTDVELLALFLRTGTRGKDVLTLAKEMLENFGSLYGLLTSEYEQFSGVHGIGVAKFAQLKGGLLNWRGVTTTCGCVKKALYSARR